MPNDSKTTKDYSWLGDFGWSCFKAIADPYILVFRGIRDTGRKLEDLKLLDIGSGDGEWLRFYSELGLNTSNLMGIELDQKRVEYSLVKNPLIKCECKDILKSEGKFDIITANVVMMYFFKELDDVILKIRDCLNKDGFFIWMDVESKDHWDGDQITPNGFSMQQIIDLLVKHKMKFVQGFNIQIPGWNGKHFMLVIQKG